LAPDDAAALFREKFRLDDLTIHRTDDWTLSVRPGQPVLGSLVLSTRSGALSFATLPAGSGAVMVDLMGQAETAARQTFGAVRINALCLMMADPLFHFHLLPRYGDPVERDGKQWTDSGWPGPPTLADNQATEDDLAEIIRAYAAFPWQ
jgi:diadenosine tetraphosphate (Ap4A) HIT family hydrolase